MSVPVLSVHKIFIAPKFCIESNFFTIVFFLDILTAPLDKHEDKITGSKSGVIVIAIATANVNASIVLCFWKFTIKTKGIKTSINLISSLLIFSMPF